MADSGGEIRSFDSFPRSLDLQPQVVHRIRVAQRILVGDLPAS